MLMTPSPTYDSYASDDSTFPPYMKHITMVL